MDVVVPRAVRDQEFPCQSFRKIIGDLMRYIGANIVFVENALIIFGSRDEAPRDRFELQTSEGMAELSFSQAVPRHGGARNSIQLDVEGRPEFPPSWDTFRIQALA